MALQQRPDLRPQRAHLIYEFAPPTAVGEEPPPHMGARSWADGGPLSDPLEVLELAVAFGKPIKEHDASMPASAATKCPTRG